MAASSSGIVRLNQLAVAPGKAVWVLFVDLVCLNSDGSLFDAGLAAAVAALRDGTWLPAKGEAATAQRRPHGRPWVRAPTEDGRRLSPVRLPKSRYDPELRQVFVSAERPIPLALGALPAAATFVRLDEYGQGGVHAPPSTSCNEAHPVHACGACPWPPRSTLLLDPTDDEEALADAVATAVARPDGQLLAYFQTSGARPLSAQHTEQIGAAAVARAVEFAALVQAAAQ